MEDVTLLVANYREAARHLWNAFLREEADWDRHDDFRLMCVQLFSTMVLAPIGQGDSDPAKAWERVWCADPIPETDPQGEHGVPILINRTHPASGYWDDPVKLVKPGDADMRFAGFFDWDVVGWRDFEFCRVVIAGFSTQPHVVGRLALIAPQYVDVMFDPSIE
jgi:hypothetical protein